MSGAKACPANISELTACPVGGCGGFSPLHSPAGEGECLLGRRLDSGRHTAPPKGSRDELFFFSFLFREWKRERWGGASGEREREK